MKKSKWKSKCLIVFTPQNFMQIKRSEQTKHTALLNSNNCFKSTQCHQNTCRNCCKRRSPLKRTRHNGNQRQRCKKMKQQMTCKQITIKSSSLTNCTKCITNRFKQNKKGSHRPTRPTGQEKSNKTNSLTNNSLVSNCAQKSNAQSKSKSCSSWNSRKERNLPKRISNQQKKKQSTQPNNSCFSSFFRQRSPCSRQTICQTFRRARRNSSRNFFFFFSKRRSKAFSTPLQMNTLQCLGIPKSTNHFTQTAQSTVSCLCMTMIQRMRSSQNQNSNQKSKQPIIHAQKASKKWQMQGHQRHTLPCFSSRSLKKNFLKIHFFFFNMYEK